MNLTSRSPVARSGAEARHLIRKFNRRLPRRFPRYRYPRGPELEYERALIAELYRMVGAVSEIYIPAVRAIFRGEKVKRPEAITDEALADAAGDEKSIGYGIARAHEAAAASRHVAMGIARAHAAAYEAAQKIDKSNREQVVGGIERLTGITMRLAEPWKPKLLRTWAQENAQKVGKISERFRTKLSNAVSQGIISGKSEDEVIAMIKAQYVEGSQVLRSERALRQLVRDQTGKLQGRMTMERHQELGINRYIWRTEMDERVRHSHAEREGETFVYGKSIKPQLSAKGLTVDEYDGPPTVPPNCRCHAEPVLDDLLSVGSDGGDEGGDEGDDGGDDGEEGD